MSYDGGDSPLGSLPMLQNRSAIASAFESRGGTRRSRPGLAVFLAMLVLGSATGIPVGGQVPVTVALLTGFNPGANPGMVQLQAKLQAEFGFDPGQITWSSQVFAFSNTGGATNFLAAAGPGSRRVLIGHSFGASSSFAVAQNGLGPLGLLADLQISVDWVSQTSPFNATTPTVPPAIVRAFNYHQTSTGFLEPVPSATILGAERNVDLEVSFNDPSIAHTSIDCDPRLHELVIARIRELIGPRPFPSTGDPVDLFVRRDTLNVPGQPAGGIAIPGVLSERAIQPVSGDQWVTIRTVAPDGAFLGAPFGILGEVFPTGLAPSPLIPGLASSLDPATIFLLAPGGIQAPPQFAPPLPGNGFETALSWPVGLGGLSVLLQSIALGANSGNGIYATSPAIALVGQ